MEEGALSASDQQHALVMLVMDRLDTIGFQNLIHPTPRFLLSFELPFQRVTLRKGKRWQVRFVFGEEFLLLLRILEGLLNDQGNRMVALLEKPGAAHTDADGQEDDPNNLVGSEQLGFGVAHAWPPRGCQPFSTRSLLQV